MNSINIQISCIINPSEDIEKVKASVFNLFPNLKIKIQNDQLSGSSENLESLINILDAIRHRKTKNAFFRILKNNLVDNSTWFYLNKQAAFVDVVALCNEANESALGPIKVVLNSNNIEKTIEKLESE
mgnify:FL=1